MIDKGKKMSSPSPKASSNGNNSLHSRSTLPNKHHHHHNQSSSSRSERSWEDHHHHHHSDGGNGLVKNKKSVLLNGRASENGDQYNRARSTSSSSSSSYSSPLKTRKLRGINGDCAEGEGAAAAAADLNDHHYPHDHQSSSKRSPQREAPASSSSAASRRSKHSEATESMSANGNQTTEMTRHGASTAKRKRSRKSSNMLHNGNEVSMSSALTSTPHQRSKLTRPSSPRHSTSTSTRHHNSSRHNSSSSHHQPSTSAATASIEQLLKPKVKVDFKIPKLKNRMDGPSTQSKDDLNDELANGGSSRHHVSSSSTTNGDENLNSKASSKMMASTSATTIASSSATSKSRSGAKSYDEPSTSSLAISKDSEVTSNKDKKKKSKQDGYSGRKRKKPRKSKGNQLSALKRLNNLCKAECELSGMFDSNAPNQSRPSFRRDLQTSLTRSFNVYNARLPPQAARRSARRLSSNSSSSNSASEHYLDLYRPEVNKTISKLVPSEYFAFKHEQTCGQECRFTVSTSLDELQVAFEQQLADCELRLAEYDNELEIAKPALEGKGFRKELSQFCLTSHELPKLNHKKEAWERRLKIGGLATQKKAVDKIRAMEFKMFSNSLDAFIFMDHQQYNVRSGRGGCGTSGNGGASYKDAAYKFILDPPKCTPLAPSDEPQVVALPTSTPVKEQPKKRGRKRSSPVPKKAKAEMPPTVGPVKTTADGTPKDNTFTEAFGHFMNVMLDDAESDEVALISEVIRAKNQKLSIVEDINKFLTSSPSQPPPSPTKTSHHRMPSPVRSARLSPSKYSSTNQNTAPAQSSSHKKGREPLDEVENAGSPLNGGQDDAEEHSNPATASTRRRALERRCLKGRRSSSRANSSENLFNEIMQTSTFMTRQQIQSLADVCGSPGGTKRPPPASSPTKTSNDVSASAKPHFTSTDDVYQHHISKLEESIESDINLLQHFSLLEQNWGFEFQKSPAEDAASNWQLITQYRAFANKLSRDERSRRQPGAAPRISKKQQQLRKWKADLANAFDEAEEEKPVVKVEEAETTTEPIMEQPSPKSIKKNEEEDEEEFSKVKLAQSCYPMSSETDAGKHQTKARRSKRTPKTNRLYENADYECGNTTASRKGGVSDVGGGASTSFADFDWSNIGDMDASVAEFIWSEEEDDDQQDDEAVAKWIADHNQGGNLTTTLTPATTDYDVDSNLVLAKVAEEAGRCSSPCTPRSRTSRSSRNLGATNPTTTTPTTSTATAKSVLANLVAQLIPAMSLHDDQDGAAEENGCDGHVNNNNNHDNNEDQVSTLLSLFQQATNQAIDQNVNTLSQIGSLMSDEVRLQDMRRKLDKLNYELVVDHSRYILNPSAVSGAQRALLDDKIERRDTMAREMSDLFYRLIGQASYNSDLYVRLPTTSRCPPFTVEPLCIRPPAPSSSSSASSSTAPPEAEEPGDQ